MLMLILLFPAVIIFSVMLATYLPHAKYRNGTLFSIKLPPEAMEHQDTQRIQARFNRQMRWTGVSMALLFMPVVLIYKSEAFQLVYYLAWMIAISIVLMMPFRRAFRDTLALKRANDWFVGPKRVIQADLRVAYLKNARVAPLALFLIPLVLSVGLLGWSFRHNELLGLGISAVVLTFLLTLMNLMLGKVKSKVYSTDSERNVLLNQAVRRTWSYAYLMLAIFENLLLWGIALLLGRVEAGATVLWWVVPGVVALIPLVVILLAYRKIKSMERQVLESSSERVDADDDEYWANGFTYHNPNDRHVFVEKRVGTGFAVNTGTFAGKLLMGGMLALVAALLIGVTFMLIRSEMTSPKLTVTPDHHIEIEYPMYSYDFAVADIEQLALVDEMPSGVKTNGEATNQYARGHFRLKQLGKARLYVFKRNPPYIQIKLADTYIYFNEKDPAQTKLLYEQIQEARLAGR